MARMIASHLDTHVALPSTAQANRRLERAVACARHGDQDALRYLYVRFADQAFAECMREVASAERACARVRRLFAADVVADYDASADGSFGQWLVARVGGRQPVAA